MTGILSKNSNICVFLLKNPYLEAILTDIPNMRISMHAVNSVFYERLSWHFIEAANILMQKNTCEMAWTHFLEH